MSAQKAPIASLLIPLRKLCSILGVTSKKFVRQLVDLGAAALVNYARNFTQQIRTVFPKSQMFDPLDMPVSCSKSEGKVDHCPHHRSLDPLFCM
jgi:hypothetical protein